MKLLKSLVFLACMQMTTVFAMEGIAIQEVDEGAASASNAAAAFTSMDPLGKAIEEAVEASVPVIIGRVITPDGRVATIVKNYTRRDVLDGLESINTGTSALIELLKTEQPDIERVMSTLSTIIGNDVLTLKPHLLQVIWALYNPESVQMLASNVGTSKDEIPRIEELGEEDL